MIYKSLHSWDGVAVGGIAIGVSIAVSREVELNDYQHLVGELD